MKKFLVLYTGYGQGCDYTIGCNKTWSFVEAPSMEDAIQELMGDHPENFSDEDIENFSEYKHNSSYVWPRYGTKEEYSYSDVEIYEICKFFDLGNLCQKYQTALADREKKFEQKKKASDEYKEYERLKKKFEGK